MTLKIAALAPMPSARVRITVMVKAGARASDRRQYRRSWRRGIAIQTRGLRGGHGERRLVNSVNSRLIGHRGSAVVPGPCGGLVWAAFALAK